MSGSENLLGTTPTGGLSYGGSAFTMKTDGSGFVVMHDFAGGASDGSAPHAGLTLDAEGNLYGTTDSGGPANLGTVFSLPRMLVVSKAGAGAGTITSDPAGLDCGTTCSASYPLGSTVTLAANPALGSTFAGWSGEGCSGTGACQVTTDRFRAVTATFEVACPDPVITSFSAAPVLVAPLASSTLSWSTSGANSVTLNGATVAASGTQVVAPATTTFYTLVATNACGSTSQTVTVNVNSGTGALAAPTITAPSPGQTLSTGGVSFAWGAVGGATGYDLRLFASSSGQTVFSGSLDGNGSTNALVSLPDGAYTFAVRACAGAPSDATCGRFGSVSLLRQLAGAE